MEFLNTVYYCVAAGFVIVQGMNVMSSVTKSVRKKIGDKKAIWVVSIVTPIVYVLMALASALVVVLLNTYVLKGYEINIMRLLKTMGWLAFFIAAGVVAMHEVAQGNMPSVNKEGCKAATRLFAVWKLIEKTK